MRRLALIAAAVLGSSGCAGKEVAVEHASVSERQSHNQVYTVSAEPIVIDQRTGWVNVKVKIASELGTDSVAFNLIVK